MQIAGLQKTTLVDYPGYVAATVFTRGCTFRCPFCHNPELVLPEKFNPLIPESEILNFLELRKGKLQALCITGGEPLLQSDIEEFINKIKKLGYKIKLDTNGSLPEKLHNIIKNSLVDYIAMDVKSSFGNYQKTTKIKNQNSKIKIKESISLLMNSGVDYEFRTTVCHPLHEIGDFEEIGKMISAAKKYFIQNFVQSKHVDSRQKFKPFSDAELSAAKKIMEKYVDSVSLR
jgi:pyruvate formate lyase activating enzyme